MSSRQWPIATGLDAGPPPFEDDTTKSRPEWTAAAWVFGESGYQVVTLPLPRQWTQHRCRSGFPVRSAGDRFTKNHTELSQTGQRGDTFGKRRILLDFSGLSLSAIKTRLVTAGLRYATQYMPPQLDLYHRVHMGPGMQTGHRLVHFGYTRYDQIVRNTKAVHVLNQRVTVGIYPQQILSISERQSIVSEI